MFAQRFEPQVGILQISIIISDAKLLILILKEGSGMASNRILCSTLKARKNCLQNCPQSQTDGTKNKQKTHTKTGEKKTGEFR